MKNYIKTGLSVFLFVFFIIISVGSSDDSTSKSSDNNGWEQEQKTVWSCKWCKEITYVGRGFPSIKGCKATGWDVGIGHGWMRLGYTGQHRFKCEKCNLRVLLSSYPNEHDKNCFAGRKAQNHKWIKK